MIRPFYCPDCKETMDLTFVPNRKRCPKCAEAWTKLRNNARQKEKEDYYKELAKTKQEKRKAEREVVQKAFNEARGLKEAELNAKINEQVKQQCKKCHFWNKPEGSKTGFCDYYLRYGVGHRVDHGNGPGDCRCFQPKKKKTKEERVDRCRISLARSEADHAR